MGIFPVLVWFPNREGRVVSEETIRQGSKLDQENEKESHSQR